MLTTPREGEKDFDCSDAQSLDKVAIENDVESNDFVTEFERNMRVLLPNFQSGLEASSADSVIGTWKSERHKKPSSRFNEEAGFLV